MATGCTWFTSRRLLLLLLLLAGTRPAAASVLSGLAPARSTKPGEPGTEKVVPEIDYEYTSFRPLTPLDWAASANEALGIRHAVILYDGTLIDDRRVMDPATVFSAYRRIKVLDPQGCAEAAVAQIPYLKEARIFRLEARVMKPDGREISVPESAIRDEALYTRTRSPRRIRSISFPQVESGDILEYFYSMATPWDGVPMVEFRHDLYTVSADLVWWFWWQKEPAPEEAIDFRSQVSLPGYSVTGLEQFDGKMELLPTREHARRLKVSFQNLPPLADEPYRPARTEIAAHFCGWYRYPGQDRVKPYWRRVAEDRGEKTRAFLEKRSRLDRWMAPILAAPRDTAQDLARCFRAVHAVVNLDELPADERPREPPSAAGLDDVLRARRGTSDDINRLFTAMLRRLHYPATPFWIRDRSQGEFYGAWENPEQFSMGGVALRRGGDLVWLFPSFSYADPVTIPWQAEDCEALLEQIDADGETSVFPSTALLPMGRTDGNTRDLHLTLRLGDRGTLIGHLEATWRCRANASERHDLALRPEEDLRRVLHGRALAGPVQWTASNEHASSDSTALTYEANAEFAGLVHDSSGTRVIDLSALRMDDYTIPAGPREFQIHFDYPKQVHTVVELAVPPGFRVDGCAPESALNTDWAGYRVRCAQEAGKVRLERDFTLKECFFYPQAADSLRAFFGRMYAPRVIRLREGAP